MLQPLHRKRPLCSRNDRTGNRLPGHAKASFGRQFNVDYDFLILGRQSADVNLIVTIAVPEEVQKQKNLPSTQRAELVLKFVKEGGQWKMDPPLWLSDPNKRERPKDLKMGTRADYAEGANIEVGGAILKLEKQTAGTVFVLRLSDQEIAVFVPAEKVSQEFVPGSILVVHGAESKTDKLKVWAEDAAL